MRACTHAQTRARGTTSRSRKRSEAKRLVSVCLNQSHERLPLPRELSLPCVVWRADTLHPAVCAYLVAICGLVNAADAVPTSAPGWASADLAGAFEQRVGHWSLPAPDSPRCTPLHPSPPIASTLRSENAIAPPDPTRGRSRGLRCGRRVQPHPWPNEEATVDDRRYAAPHTPRLVFGGPAPRLGGRAGCWARRPSVARPTLGLPGVLAVAARLGVRTRDRKCTSLQR